MKGAVRLGLERDFDAIFALEGKEESETSEF